MYGRPSSVFSTMRTYSVAGIRTNCVHRSSVAADFQTEGCEDASYISPRLSPARFEEARRLNTNANVSSMLQDVAHRYGIARYSWNVENSLYKSFAAVKINCDEGTILLKPFVGTIKQLQSVTMMLEELWLGGYRHMPRLRRTITGGRFVVLGNDKYYATDWVEGETLDESEAHLFRLGGALAKLHHQTIADDSQSRNPSCPTELKLSQLRRYDARCRGIRVKGRGRTKDQRWYVSLLPQFSQMADEAWEQVTNSNLRHVLEEELYHRSPVHGDVTRFNVIVEPNDDIRLIDWDRVKIGSRWMEIVNALSNTARFRPVEMAALLRGYESEAPLTKEQRQLVAALYRLPREAWYAYRRQGANEVWNEELLSVLERTWDERVAAIDWMDAWANGGRQAI